MKIFLGCLSAKSSNKKHLLRALGIGWKNFTTECFDIWYVFAEIPPTKQEKVLKSVSELKAGLPTTRLFEHILPQLKEIGTTHHWQD